MRHAIFAVCFELSTWLTWGGALLQNRFWTITGSLGLLGTLVAGAYAFRQKPVPVKVRKRTSENQQQLPRR